MVSEKFDVARVMPERTPQSDMFVNRQQAWPAQLSCLITLGADSLVTFQFAI